MILIAGLSLTSSVSGLNDRPKILIILFSTLSLQKETIFNWHLEDGADDSEINRTWAIADYQQDKPNPFIIDSTLIERIYFWEDILSGDVNVDHTLNILDAVAMVSMIIDQSSYSDELIDISDMNQDNQLDVLDIVMLIQIIVGS